MKTNNVTLHQIRNEGIKALVDKLGVVGMIRFIQQYELGEGDYTKSRHRWLKDNDVARLAQKIQTGTQSAYRISAGKKANTR